ncbi:hypothetical protein IAI58_19180 (plasmid) [Roseomonas marmotae]|uniref:hypothetical protein n=1 Tax=Roseomonas marmotae TaxID=2768161 RepID=UPI001AD74993|nr:hypothetical protein [Roseomonas marmotae]QTI81467.1 hypothetical protein IAI58_19180 [Roseomonas marmotae]
MPTSKKPRKRYVPRHRPQYAQFLPQRTKDDLTEIFTNIELIVEVKLPRGTLCQQDVAMMRDYLNLGTALLHLGHHIPQEFILEVDKVWRETQDAFGALYRRSRETGCYTAYASEIVTLRDGFAQIGEVIRFEFEHEPAWLLDVFHGVKIVTDGKGYQRMSVDMDALERKVLQVRSARL